MNAIALKQHNSQFLIPDSRCQLNNGRKVPRKPEENPKICRKAEIKIERLQEKLDGRKFVTRG